MWWTLLCASALANGGPDDWTRATPMGDARGALGVRTRLVEERLRVVFGPGLDDVVATATYTLDNPGPPETVRYAVPVLDGELREGGKDAASQIRIRWAGSEVPCAIEPVAAPIDLGTRHEGLDHVEMINTVVARACVAELTVPSGPSTLVLEVTQEPLHESWSTSKDLHAGTSNRKWVWMLSPAGSWSGTVDSVDIDLDLGPFAAWAKPSGAGWKAAGGHLTKSLRGVDLAKAEPLSVLLEVAHIDRQERLLDIGRRGLWWRPGEARASSTLAPQAGNRYDARNLVDLDPATAWCEGAAGAGRGEWVELTFSKTDGLPPYVSDESCGLALAVLPGYAKSDAAWRANGRVRSLVISTCDGKKSVEVPVEVADLPAGAMVSAVLGADYKRFPVADAVLAQWYAGKRPACVRVAVGEVIPGASYADTCISELLVWPACPG